MIGILINNPEFKRNVWQDMSVNRMLMLPIILGLIFLVTYIADSDDYIQHFSQVSIGLYSLIIFIWGTKLAADAVIGEMNDRTWDSQRLTVLSPLQMSVGKLFGSTIYQWYGAGFCMLIYFICAFQLNNSRYLINDGIMMLILGVFAHALAISLSLISIERNRHKSKVNSTLIFIISLLIALMLSKIIQFGMMIKMFEIEFNWYTIPVNYEAFSIFSILFFTIWAVIGLYRGMKSEFQILGQPWYYITFVLTSMLYFFGLAFNLESNTWLAGGYFSFYLVIVLTYFFAVSEKKDIVAFRQLVTLFNKKDWINFSKRIPLWMINIAFVFVFSILLLIFTPLNDFPHVWMGMEIDYHISELFSINILFFVIRDICLLLFLNLRENTKRADPSFLLYLAVLYIVLPMLFTVSSQFQELAMVCPMPNGNLFYGTIIPGLQAFGMFLLMRNKFLQRNEKFKGSQIGTL